MDAEPALELIIDLSKYYKYELDDTQMTFYIDFFKTIDIKAGIFLIAQTVKKSKFFPKISELREYLGLNKDPKIEANEMAGLIIPLISECGRYRSKEAAKKMGPICWHSVQRFGGWERLCDSPCDKTETIRAQLRDICISVLSIKERIENKCITQSDYQKIGTENLKYDLKLFEQQLLLGN